MFIVFKYLFTTLFMTLAFAAYGTELTKNDLSNITYSVFTDLAKPIQQPSSKLEKSIFNADVLLCVIKFEETLENLVYGKTETAILRTTVQKRLNKVEVATLDRLLLNCKGITMPKASLILANISRISGSTTKVEIIEKKLTDKSHALPEILNVIGLIPGSSTKEEINVARADLTNFAIGGFSLKCDIEFIDEKLGSMACFTGQPNYSFDLNSKNKLRIADNNEIHDVLLVGLKNKFGSPQKNQNNIIQNQFGVKFKQHVAIWKDSGGNTLTITNINGAVDTGLLLLESKAYLEKKASDDASSTRKF